MTGALAGLTVTVVGIYYAPDSTGIAPYTTDLCETLTANGATVSAIVGIPHYPQWTADRHYRRRLRYVEHVNGVRLVRVRHFVPRSQDALRRGLYEASFWLGSLAATRGLEPDVVLGVTPNLGGAATARLLANRRRVPCAVIVQDLVGSAASQAGLTGGSTVSRLVGALEATIVRGAERVAIISDAYNAPLLEAGVQAARIQTLPNYVHIRSSQLDRAEARRTLGWPLTGRVIVHSGNMGFKQGLENVVDAARLAVGRRNDLRFVLIGDGSTRRDLQKRASGLPNVQFLDAVSADDYPVVLAAADCLLLNERPTVLNMSMPSKLTSYMSAGRPVVAATHPAGATAAELRRARAGLIVAPGDPAALLAGLEQVLDNEQLAVGLAECGRRYAEQELSGAAARTRVVDFVRSVAKNSLSPETGAPHPPIQDPTPEVHRVRLTTRALAKTAVRRALRQLGYEVTRASSSFSDLQRQLLRNSDLLVDVGANTGQYADRVRGLGYSRRIVSFEPQSEALAVLRNRTRRATNWEVRPTALGETAGVASLRVSRNSVSSSILAIEAEHVRAAPRSAVAYCEDVDVSTLDLELAADDGTDLWVKLDVQGAELGVLRGGAETLRRTRVVQIELSFAKLYQDQADYVAVIDFLRSANFHLWHVEPGFQNTDSGRLLQMDGLFVRN